MLLEYPNVKICNFDYDENDTFSIALQYFPKVFKDNRGSFTEVLRENAANEEMELAQLADLSWIKQINRSTSEKNVCRGMHAQKEDFCQSKFVECIYGCIYDFIVDARPNSTTFGKIGCFKLDSQKANKLFVPEGFLHGFFSPDTGVTNIFQYYVGGNIYSKEHEFSVDMYQILHEFKNGINVVHNDFNDFENQFKNCIRSEKDTYNNLDYYEWMDKVKKQFSETGKLWYK